MFSHPLALLGYTEDRAPEVAAHGDPALEAGLCVSVLDGTGIGELHAAITNCTVVLLGESGAGKSTLTDLITGGERLETGEVRSDGQGRHTTTHRRLVPLPDGGAIIDTPGVREAGYWGERAGIFLAFGDVEERAGSCRFADCRHESEPGCAVRAAVSAGSLEPGRIEAWRRAVREQAWLERRLDRRATSEQRSRWKLQTRSRRRDTRYA